MDNVIIKIVRQDGKTFTISRNSDWRFKKKSKLDGFGKIANSISFTDNATTDGGIITATHLSKVDRTIQCVYCYPSLNAVARKQALSFFNAKAKYKIYVTYDERTVWAEGYVYKFDCTATVDPSRLLNLSVTFLFENPYWKSNDDFGKDIASITGLIGFPYLVSKDVAPVGLTGGKFNFDKKVILNNDGDADTNCRAVIKATGDVVNPSIVINGQYVKLIDELENGDVVEIDFTAMPPTVKKNGVNFIGHCDRTSAFDEMELVVGDSEISFDADDGSDLMTVTISYNKLYATI